MGNLKEIRLRIGAIKNTRKITQAMGRIASARLFKAQQAVTAARPYAERLAEVVQALTAATDDAAVDPLMAPRDDVRGVGIILVSADRGLCGGFNANVTKAALQRIAREKEAGREVTVIAVGKKGAGALKYNGIDVDYRHEVPSHDDLIDTVKAVATEATGLFLPMDGATPTVDVVYIIYNFFRNALVQEVTETQLLPFKPAEVDPEAPPVEPVFEPDRTALLAHLLPVALESQIQTALLNSISSELASRRTAMNSATDNATELIDDLTLQFNRERQAAITTELMEIIGGSEALKG